MTAFNARPKAAFVPILVVWFGIGVGPAILTAFLISFFAIMVNIATGLGHAGARAGRRAARAGCQTMGRADQGRPAALHAVFLRSLKVAITLAFVGTTVSEMTAANEGIGYLLTSAGSSMQMGLAFAGPMVVDAMAISIYELCNVIEKRNHGMGTPGNARGVNSPGRYDQLLPNSTARLTRHTVEP